MIIVSSLFIGMLYDTIYHFIVVTIVVLIVIVGVGVGVSLCLFSINFLSIFIKVTLIYDLNFPRFCRYTAHRYPHAQLLLIPNNEQFQSL